MVQCILLWDNLSNTDDNSFDKDIPDADSKKIIQHHFKLKPKKIYMENTWGGECDEKETFNVMINVRPCTITRQGHSVSCESCKNFSMGRKIVFVLGICGLFKINVLN